MKRLCYLLLWLLTGFSIAANETATRQPQRLANAGIICAPEQTPVASLADQHLLPAHAPEKAEIPENNIRPVTSLICSAAR